MSLFQVRFDASVWRIVANIPAGQVLAYGEVARAAGFPRHARMVSKAMSRATEPLPWHRVIRADRSLAFPIGTQEYERQIVCLMNEGISVINGKVMTTKPSSPDDLDALIWGPN